MHIIKHENLSKATHIINMSQTKDNVNAYKKRLLEIADNVDVQSLSLKKQYGLVIDRTDRTSYPKYGRYCEHTFLSIISCLLCKNKIITHTVSNKTHTRTINDNLILVEL